MNEGRIEERRGCWLGTYARGKTIVKDRVLVGHVWKSEDKMREESASWARLEEGRQYNREESLVGHVWKMEAARRERLC